MNALEPEKEVANMIGKISPSMMCADYRRLEDVIRELDQAGVEYLHCDIMDGIFVPNYTMGANILDQIREMTSIPLDIHLMVQDPDRSVSYINIQPGEMISVHYESSVHLQRTLAAIREKGAKPCVALNPSTPIDVLEYVLDDIDAVLIMTVNPGYAGQRLVPVTITKIKKLKEYLIKNGYSHIEIEVDGNVSYENAKKMRRAGADIFVAGTSSLFTGKGISKAATQLRECIL